MKASNKEKPVKSKEMTKSSDSKSTKAKPKASSSAADHSYAGTPTTKKVKVNFRKKKNFSQQIVGIHFPNQ